MKKINLIILISSFLLPSNIFGIVLGNYLKVIEEIKSPTDPIWVFEDNKFRCITFDPEANFVQSCIEVNHKKRLAIDYYRVSLATLLFNSQPKNILIIGVGGGVLLKTFNELVPSANIEGVEINPDVLKVAKQHFGLKESNKLKIIQADAVQFIQKVDKGQYDIIILDACTQDAFPAAMLNLGFLEQLKSILSKDGILFINGIDTSKTITKEIALFNEVLKEYFVITINGSQLIIANSTGTKPVLQNVENLKTLWGEKFYEVGVSINGLIDILNKN